MPRLKICDCGKIIPDTVKCECKIKANNARNREKEKNNPEEKIFFNSARWKKLRQKIILRDEAHCQRCKIKYNMITISSLQVHHIKPRINFPE
jgi:5-methylcytosine-specific restriction endonuclease McrA